MTARRCQCCERTAMLGTPAAADAIDPHNCPRCDHFYMHALAGGSSSFRGVDSPVFVAPAPTPAAPVPAPAPSAPKPPRRPAAPLSLPQLLTACTALALARFGAWAKLGTLDAFTWQVVCVDPCDPGVVLTDHPSAVGETPDAAAVAFCDALHELNLADAAAADERAAEVLAHRIAHPELEGPEPSPLPGDDGRFDARPRSLADAYPGLPFAFTVTPDGDVLDTATGAPLGPEAAAADRAEVA